MYNQTTKTKYLIQSAVIAVVFMFFSSMAQASEITPDNIIKYVNLARASQGVDSLIINDKLMKVAQDKLNDMLNNKYFAHTSPTGVNPWYWFQHENYDYHFAGENLAINFVSAEGEQAAWMASPMHKKNILDSNFQEIGVAVGKQEVDGQTSIIAVQEFGTTFAGARTGDRNFSPLGKKQIIEENNQLVPQVLSVKNVAEPKTGLAEWFGNNKIEIMDMSVMIVAMLFILSTAIMAGAFLSVALDNLVAILETKKQKVGIV